MNVSLHSKQQNHAHLSISDVLVEMEKNMTRLTTTMEEARVLRSLGTFMTSGTALINGLPLVAKEFPNFAPALDTVGKQLVDVNMTTELFAGLDEYFSSFVPHIMKYGGMGGVPDRALLLASEMLDSAEKLLARGVPQVKINEVNYYRLLAFMVHGNCPILTAMKIAGEEYLPAEIRASVEKPVRKGDMLSDGFRANPDFFSEVGIAFVFVGEMTGALPEVCAAYAKLRLRQLFLPASPQSEEILDYGHLRLLLLFVSNAMPLEKFLTVVSKASATPSRKAAFEALAAKVKDDKSDTALGNAMQSMPDDFAPWITTLVQQAKTPEELENVFGKVIDQLCQQLGKEKAP